MDADGFEFQTDTPAHGKYRHMVGVIWSVNSNIYNALWLASQSPVSLLQLKPCPLSLHHILDKSQTYIFTSEREKDRSKAPELRSNQTGQMLFCQPRKSYKKNIAATKTVWFLEVSVCFSVFCVCAHLGKSYRAKAANFAFKMCTKYNHF